MRPKIRELPRRVVDTVRRLYSDYKRRFRDMRTCWRASNYAVVEFTLTENESRGLLWWDPDANAEREISRAQVMIQLGQQMRLRVSDEPDEDILAMLREIERKTARRGR